jgi:hypothetical protein
MEVICMMARQDGMPTMVRGLSFNEFCGHTRIVQATSDHDLVRGKPVGQQSPNIVDNFVEFLVGALAA